MDYYISFADGKYIGPLKKDELLKNGLTPATLVWHEGMESWTKAGELHELDDIMGNIMGNTPPLPSAPQPPAGAMPPKLEPQVATQPAPAKKQAPVSAAKQSSNPRFKYPAPTWKRESIFLLVCVIVHMLLAITGSTKVEYLGADAVGLALCIATLVTATKIKKLNDISFAEGSESRLKADRLARINGLTVSATAAIGFLIILFQSSLHIYKG